jgi:hypothetical protein
MLQLSALTISLITFAVIFAGALLGMSLRAILPEHHLSADSKDFVRLGTGLIATISALVLGLLIASAESSFETQSSQIRQITAKIILLENLLVRSGPETEASRILLRRSVVSLVDRIWRENSSESAKAAPFEASAAADTFYDKIQELSPRNDAQRALLAQAMQVSIDLAQTRILMFAQTDNTIPMPFLAVLVFWLTIIFGSFGLFARPNATVVTALFVFALSASASIFLILELSHPFTGLMRISSAPLSNALVPIAP